MARCDDEHFSLIIDTIGDGGFQDVKKTFVMTVCQNFTFTSEQVGQLLGCFDFSTDKVEAVDCFETSMIDPRDTDPVLDAFDSDGDKDAVLEKLSSFRGVEPREIRELRIEDDGHRSEEAMERILQRIDDANMSSDKVAAIEAEIKEHPSPPFDQEQLCAILDKFSFTSDKETVLNMFVGPQIVYPMLCTQIVEVLDAFSMSSDKIAMLPALKPYIYDRQNKLTIVASFNFSSDKKKAEEILRDVVVNFKPKTPPVSRIQKALKAIGRCPAGFDWVQVYGGWRCQAGGHWVSDLQIQQYFEGSNEAEEEDDGMQMNAHHNNNGHSSSSTTTTTTTTTTNVGGMTMTMTVTETTSESHNNDDHHHHHHEEHHHHSHSHSDSDHDAEPAAPVEEVEVVLPKPPSTRSVAKPGETTQEKLVRLAPRFNEEHDCTADKFSIGKGAGIMGFLASLAPNWQTRYFKIKGALITYDTSKGGEQKGSIALTPKSKVHTEPDSGLVSEFKLHNKDVVLEFEYGAKMHKLLIRFPDIKTKYFWADLMEDIIDYLITAQGV